MASKGRPRIVSECPDCGSEDFKLYHTRLVGHVTNRWYVCLTCGARIRYAQAGETIHRVREAK